MNMKIMQKKIGLFLTSELKYKKMIYQEALVWFHYKPHSSKEKYYYNYSLIEINNKTGWHHFLTTG